jgi:geranylgeranyl diphosphate synthase type I
MQSANETQAALLRADLGRRDLGPAEIASLREIIVSTGALAAVEERIATGAAQARQALTDVLSPDAREALDGLVAAATQRRT